MPANTVAVHVPVILSQKLQKNYDNNSVMMGLVNKELSSDLAEFGDTVHMSKLGDVSIGNYNIATDIPLQVLTSTDSSLTLNQRKVFHFSVDILEELTAKHAIGSNYLNRAGVAMGLVVDNHLLGLHTDTAAGNVIGSDALPVTVTKDNVYDLFTMAGLRLDEANIPTGDRVAVVSPAICRLIQLSLVNRETTLGDTAVSKSYVGDYAGFKIHKTTNLTAVSGVFNLMFFHKDDFIHHVMRVPPSKTTMYSIHSQFGNGYKGLTFYGSKVFNTTAGVVIKAVLA